MRDVLLQIAGFVIGAGVLGLLTGWVTGRASARDARRAARAAEAAWLAREPDVVVRERVLVRPDAALYAENERLRDRLVVLQARVVALGSQVAELEARAAAALDAPRFDDVTGLAARNGLDDATRPLSLVTDDLDGLDVHPRVDGAAVLDADSRNGSAVDHG